MFPFYDQGLIVGMEDVHILFDLLDTHHAFDRLSDPAAQDHARADALQAYSALRVSDAHAIHGLSHTNYLLLRGGVNSPAYRIRKSIEEYLQRYAPLLGWRTLYSRVSFSDQRDSWPEMWLIDADF
ncbi:kynurenine 3-monooxygenase, mitochondrial precursor [Aspergillus melleus]|uniref:Kynurenine 3-monooxygenase, mitochondrial n=1 Tax=Aspergillus melleus TaxID=138277 RepID=A0ACC3ARU1_9EURO|nr:kynurenine 3-monooxygenase, mitochondrial precursor [Aspergillus melleus]